jgi:hypothetical protein
MPEAEMYTQFCGGYQCDQPGEIEVLAGRSGGTLGWLCGDHADDLNRDLERTAEKNKERLLAESPSQ